MPELGGEIAAPFERALTLVTRLRQIASDCRGLLQSPLTSRGLSPWR